MKKFDLITSFAMFYDLENLINFALIYLIFWIKNGIWVSEFSYFPLFIKKFDI